MLISPYRGLIYGRYLQPIDPEVMAIESWFTNTINTHAHMPTANRICHLAELGGQGVKSHSQKMGNSTTWKVDHTIPGSARLG